jgi:hypothetical protein
MASTRGPLPPGVYWRRRVFVGLLALGVVFVSVNLLRSGSDGSSDDPVAEQAAGEVEASHTVTVQPSEQRTQRRGKGGRAPIQGPTFDPTVLADPEGTCAPADVVAVPTIDEAVAGRPVTIGLSLQTLQADACTWRIAPKRVVVKISGEYGDVWTSQQCRAVVPNREVVVRRALATVVELTWNARESDTGCPEATEWVLPGRYRVAAAALGGEPRVLDFRLERPTAATVTPSPQQTGPAGSASSSPSGRSSDTTANPGSTSTPRSGGDDVPNGGGSPPRR